LAVWIENFFTGFFFPTAVLTVYPRIKYNPQQKFKTSGHFIVIFTPWESKFVSKCTDCTLLAVIVFYQLTFCSYWIKRGFTANWNETCRILSKSSCCRSPEG